MVASCRVALFSPAAQANTTADVTFVFQEALRYFNETTKQKEMLEFALNYLQTDDEVCCCCRCRTEMVEGRIVLGQQSDILSTATTLKAQLTF